MQHMQQQEGRQQNKAWQHMQDFFSVIALSYQYSKKKKRKKKKDSSHRWTGE